MNKQDNKDHAHDEQELTHKIIQELQDQPDLDENLRKALSENPEAVGNAITQIAFQHKQESYNSPFPHPDHLERFNTLYPEAAETVFREFQKQGDHRREMEAIIVDRGTKFDGNAQKFGFYTSIILVGASLLGMQMGWEALSYGILGFGVAPIVSSYFGKFSKKEK